MADTTGDKRINTYYKDGTWQSISFGTYSSPSNFNAFGHGTCGISSLGSNIVAVTYDLDSSLGYNFLKSWIYNGATWSAPTNIYIGYYPSLAASSEQLGLAYSTSLANSSLGFAYSTDGSTWVTEIVDSDGDVGVYPTMLFDGTVPVIVYYDVSNDALKIAIKDGGWHVFTFDISGSISKNLVAFINNGIIHVTWITDDGSGEIYHFSFSIRQYHAYPQTGIAQRYFPNKSFGMSPLMRDAFVLNLLRRARSTTRFIHHLPGTADVYNQFAAHLPGTADVYNQFAAHLPGMASILLPITHDLPGVSSVRDGYTHDLPGVSSVYRTFDNTLPGVSSVLLPVTHHLPGVARIANDASNRYELFIGVDAEPDLTSPPTQTFTTLPYDVSLTLPGAGTQTTYHLVIQKRNRFGVVTLNNVSQKITIDSNGDEQPTPPRGPLEVAMTEVASLKAAITAQYAYAADGDDQADTWLVYITTTGIDPDPTSGGDTPVEVAMVKTEATASLAYTTASEVLATVIKVLVRTRRSGVAGADSTNTTALSLTLAGSALTAVTLTDALMGSLAPVQPE
ncbi:MAG: hypothetical protein JKX85_11965 [Phycisphaeraceae bacterium]|nr:hypothetical protein [Phycisphaeraceae bacterium]